MPQNNPNFDEDLEQETQLEPPYKVIIHNDDITTFEFVIRILQTIFELNIMVAEQIAWQTHTKGGAYVATYPRPEAERRVAKAHFAAQLENFPLRFTIEPENIWKRFEPLRAQRTRRKEKTTKRCCVELPIRF